jgi:hypothetical protein
VNLGLQAQFGLFRQTLLGITLFHLDMHCLFGCVLFHLDFNLDWDLEVDLRLSFVTFRVKGLGL